MFAADRLDHVAFTARDLDALARWVNFEQAKLDLDRLGIAYDVWDHGICDSLYLEDPEGHQIELTTYRS
jgi:catechol-2,3-dioxygenase